MAMFEIQYLALLRRILERGVRREVRNGETMALFGESIDADLQQGFPMITTRHMSPRGVVGELAGFLQGAVHSEQFKQLGCNYWDFNAKQWGRGGYLGRIYGAQWRSWRSVNLASEFKETDQLRELIKGLRMDPTGRRHVMTTWNPGELDNMALPPCHLLTQYYVDGRYLDCCVYMRSVDVCLGLPSDFVLYALLQMLIAWEVAHHPRRLTFFMGDTHIYAPHIDQAIEQTNRSPYEPPTVRLTGEGLFNFQPDDAVFSDYNSWPAIKYELL